MTTLKSYRMSTTTLAKIRAINKANPRFSQTDIIRIAIDLLYAAGSPSIAKPTKEDAAAAYQEAQDEHDRANILQDDSILQDIANELYMLSLE